MKNILVLLALIALLCGCAGEKKAVSAPANKTISCSTPYILSEGSCCLDMDGNGVCDAAETNTSNTVETSTTRTQTGGKTTTTSIIKETCSDGIQDQNETGVDCGGPCKPCRNRCEILINDTAVKPAARTVKLCLAGNTPVSYGGYNFTSSEDGGVSTIFAADANGTVKRSQAAGRDMFFGNVVLRLIGTADQRGIHYTYVYAWTIEGGVKCTTNDDCGNEQSIGFDCFSSTKIVKKYLYYHCIQPGTILSDCQALQRQEDYLVCDEGDRCSAGDSKCYPKNCFNDVSDKDEEGVDCGGSCLPCYCTNDVMDGDETGVDCGGSCKACEGAPSVDKVPPAIKIISPQNKAYDKRAIDLTYGVSEPVSWCGYVLNGGPMMTLKGNGSLYARPGTNDLTVYCNDTSGNGNQSRRLFNVSLIQGMVCQSDKVSSIYDQHFDGATFYLDTEDYLGVPDRCTQAEYEYSVTGLADTDSHARIMNGSDYMRDANLSVNAGAFLAYECSTTGKLRASYVKLKKSLADPKTLSRMRMIIYFKESGLESDPGAFWSVYAYQNDGKTPSEGGYINVPYRPLASSCANASFQEIDLAPLLDKMQTSDVQMRLGFYTSRLNAQINLLEIETYSETKKK